LHNKERAHLRMKQSMTEDADAEGGSGIFNSNLFFRRVLLNVELYIYN
jgi:hypothetical protein